MIRRIQVGSTDHADSKSMNGHELARGFALLPRLAVHVLDFPL